MFYRLLSCFLFLLPAEFSHHVTLRLLRFAYNFGLLRLFISRPKAKPVTCFGLEFPNCVGLAAGLDKNADYIDALAALGFGFIEVGTVTPQPQVGNAKPRLFRLIRNNSLINHMGFNNKGVDYLVQRVKESNYSGILGINIGKNSVTPNQDAINDYLTCLRKVYELASYITINISSPNTKGLRDLQYGKELDNLLSTLKLEQDKLNKRYKSYVPLLIKIAPDLAAEQLSSIAKSLLKFNIDGVIATNSLSSRQGLEHITGVKLQGGISGKLLQSKSTEIITLLAKYLDGKIPIIGVGGIDSSDIVKTKLDAGAKLVQLYTGLIYKGPGLIKKVLRKE